MKDWLFPFQQELHNYKCIFWKVHFWQEHPQPFNENVGSQDEAITMAWPLGLQYIKMKC